MLFDRGFDDTNFSTHSLSPCLEFFLALLRACVFSVADEPSSNSLLPHDAEAAEGEEPGAEGCGVHNASFLHTNMLRIVGGTTAPRGAWPWQVAVLNRFKASALGDVHVVDLVPVVTGLC